MVIPFVGGFSIIKVTNFPVYILSSLIVSVCILIWDNNSASWDEMVNSLGACITKPTPRVCPIMKNISQKISCEEALTISPALLSHWWMSCNSTSAFSIRCGYWSCNGFDFQAVSIAFFLFCLAIFFNFRAFFVFFVSPSNSVSRSRPIFCANSLAFLQQTVNLFFHASKLPWL